MKKIQIVLWGLAAAGAFVSAGLMAAGGHGAAATVWALAGGADVFCLYLVSQRPISK